MTQPEDDKTQPKGARGRPFAKGNAGRRPGSKNRLSAISALLLAGEEQDLVRRAIELAKAGDTQMLKFLLNRILPRERAVKVNLPKTRSRRLAPSHRRSLADKSAPVKAPHWRPLSTPMREPLIWPISSNDSR